MTIDPAAVKQKGKGKKAPAPEPVGIPFGNIEKAVLIPEI